MQSISIVKKTEIINTPRVMQLSGMFDIPPHKHSEHRWDISLPIDEKPWNIGLIVGPSGCGKTTIINEIFSDYVISGFNWDNKKSILDDFPKTMSIKDISYILNSVGFSSPKSWFKPYHILSNGEKFRVDVARAIAESPDICVIDEFTSVVDRTVAKIGSFAISKTIRRMNKKFIAVSCHYDIEEWLQPDWVYKPAENEFHWRVLQRRPKIELEIFKVHSSAWKYFKQHHYLTADILRSAQCFVGSIKGSPVAFMSYIHFQNNVLKKTKKGHRSVVLPDYQGVGIGLKFIDYIASALKSKGYDFIGRTAHPLVNYYRSKSSKWKCISKPMISLNKGRKGKKNASKYFGRLVSTYRFVGDPIDINEARRLLQ